MIHLRATIGILTVFISGILVVTGATGCERCGRGSREAVVHREQQVLERSEAVARGESERPDSATGDGISGEHPEAPLTRAQLARSIERAAAVIAGFRLRGDQSWLVGRGARLLGERYAQWADRIEVEAEVLKAAKKDPRKEDNALEGAMWKARGLSARALTAPSVPLVQPVDRVPSRFERAQAPEVAALMRFALTCTEQGARGGVWKAMYEQPASGYLLAHQLLSLVMAYERACFDLAAVERYRESLARRLLAEQLAERHAIHDLSVERMAVLCHAGLCHWVPERDFGALVRDQQADGSWPSRGPENLQDIDWRPHTTALAFYALARRWADTDPGAAERSSAERPRAPIGLKTP